MSTKHQHKELPHPITTDYANLSKFRRAQRMWKPYHYVIVGLVLLVPALFFLFQIGDLWDTFRLTQNSATVQGQVFDVTESTAKNGGKYVSAVEYRFTVNTANGSETYTSREDVTGSSGPYLGTYNNVSVSYLPSDPRISRITGTFSNGTMLFDLIKIVIGFVLLIFAAILLVPTALGLRSYKNVRE